MRNLLVFAVLIFATLQVAWAQNMTVKGKVSDTSGESIVGANVFVKGTTIGTVTDLNGDYTLQADKGATLIIKFIGMTPVEVVVRENPVINVTLDQSTINIDEVVAVGYGVQKKSDITGAVGSVKFDELPSQGMANVDQALQGRMPGVQVTSNSGQPGSALNVRIRGIGTVNDSDPLYVVDGLPVSDISFLNPNDIESIEVLKDASASAIYGSRGANGVVLVTSKKGKYNSAANITVNAYYGVQSVLNNWETTTGQEWYDIQLELNETRSSAIDLSLVDPSITTDWFDEITRTSYMEDVNVSINGGSEDLTFALSLGHFNQDGTVDKTGFSRNSIKLNTEYKARKNFTVGANINAQQSETQSQTIDSYHSGLINTAIKIEPVISVRQDDGSYDYSKYTDYPNPVAQIEYNNSNSEMLNINGNIFGRIKLYDGFVFKSSLGVTAKRYDSYNFVPEYYVNVNQQNLINSVTRGYSKTDYYNWENTLTYDKTFGKHTLGALIGHSVEETRNEDMTGSKKDIPNEDESMWYLDAATDAADVSGGASELAYLSYLGRINYNYDNKYLATVNFRADGSSRFPEGNEWGYFPSFALGWKMTEEDFLSNVTWLESLKLRTGWGQVGNDKIGNYPYQSTMDGYEQYRYLYGDDETVEQGYVVVGMVDSEIQWEIVESFNVGFDALLFNGMLETSVDWYKKTTKDMLLDVPIPYYYGYESGPTSNVGSVENSGVEVMLNHQNRINGDFSYNVGVNFSTLKNEVTDIGNSTAFSAGAYYLGNATRFDEGETIGYFYGYKTDGLFQTQDEIDNAPVQLGTANEGLEPGDLKFADTNGDGFITSDDQVKIGDPLPKLQYGINLGANYKGFGVSMFFQGTYGNDIFNAMKTHLYAFDATNKHKDMLNSWTSANTNTNMPRLNGSDANNTNRTSDRFVEDGSYFRLKNVTVSYDIPTSLTSRMHISGLNVYFSGQNLWTVTNYTGADPEIGQRSSSNYLSRGVDIGNYPQSKIYTFGLKLNL